MRWVNAHLLGPLDLTAYLGRPTQRAAGCKWKGVGIDGLAVECNRPFRSKPDDQTGCVLDDPAEWWGWCKALVDQATNAGVPVWVKQGPTATGRVTHKLGEFPEWARRREFPGKESS